MQDMEKQIILITNTIQTCNDTEDKDITEAEIAEQTQEHMYNTIQTPTYTNEEMDTTEPTNNRINKNKRKETSMKEILPQKKQNSTQNSWYDHNYPTLNLQNKTPMVQHNVPLNLKVQTTPHSFKNVTQSSQLQQQKPSNQN